MLTYVTGLLKDRYLAASRIRAGQALRLFASIGNVVISVLNRVGHGNHAAARRDLAWDRTGTRALALLGL